MQRNTLKKATVLVLDGDMPHAVTIVRSLARAGFAVKVAAHGEKPIASYSRWAKETLSYPDPLEQQGSFVGWARELLQRREFELVIPVTERTMVPLARDPDISVCTNVIAMPDRESLEVVLDKDRTFELAGKLDIAYPSSLTVRSVQEAESVAGQLGYPVVLKPARSVGAANGQRVQLKVEYAHSPEEYRSRIGELLRFGPVILQEYFSGEGVGVELIANRGIVKYTFQHRRLHELPLTGGGSTLRESVEVNRELEAASTALIKALNWHGVAMVEFKYNPDSGEYRLMEINGRFWGSLPLAVSAGADFPAMLAELHLDGSIRERPPARVGVRCRRLQTDLQWYEAVLRAYGGSRLVTLPGR